MNRYGANTRQQFQRRYDSTFYQEGTLRELIGPAHGRSESGFIRAPALYGLELEEYQRHEAADRDKSWTAKGVDINATIEAVSAHDPYVGASLTLIRAFGLRRKESIMLRPNLCVVPFEKTALPESEKQAEQYVWISQGAKNGRPRGIPLDSPMRVAAIDTARKVVTSKDAHMGDPMFDLKHNLRRFDYVVSKFKLTRRQLGVTAHGLRHEALIDEFVRLTGEQPPVRDGAMLPAAEARLARLKVSALAGHSRMRASAAYLVSCPVNKWHIFCMELRYLLDRRYRHGKGPTEG